MLRAHLTREKAIIATRARSGKELARATDMLRKTRRSARRWALPSLELADLPAVFQQSFRASRKAMARAQTRWRVSDFHRWRKRVKSLWYQLRLAERVVTGLSAEIGEFNRLDTELGEEHNLAMLRAKLARDPRLRNIKSEVNKLRAMSTALEDERRRSALVLGTRLHAAAPKQFAKDLRRRLRPKGTRGAKAVVAALPARGRVRQTR
jgi:CHAD domain